MTSNVKEPNILKISGDKDVLEYLERNLSKNDVKFQSFSSDQYEYKVFSVGGFFIPVSLIVVLIKNPATLYFIYKMVEKAVIKKSKRGDKINIKIEVLDHVLTIRSPGDLKKLKIALKKASPKKDD